MRLVMARPLEVPESTTRPQNHQMKKMAAKPRVKPQTVRKIQCCAIYYKSVQLLGVVGKGSRKAVGTKGETHPEDKPDVTTVPAAALMMRKKTPRMVVIFISEEHAHSV